MTSRGSVPRRVLLAGLLALVAAAAVLALILGRDETAPAITHGPRDRPLVALTFDADMTPNMLARLRSGEVRRWYDPDIVKQLSDTRTPATVFLTGLWARVYPGVVRSLAADPLFELENHSVDHAAFQKGCFGLPVVESDDGKRWEIAKAAAVIAEVAGVKPRYFRFPGGCHSDEDLRLVESLRARAVNWDVVSGDAFLDDPGGIADEVLRQVRPGSIVAMHLMGAPNAPGTAKALRKVIPELRRRGFKLVTVGRLLDG